MTATIRLFRTISIEETNTIGYYSHGYRHFFQLTPDGMQAVREHTTRPRLS